MADKSLSTIASELWQGFGNNPRNVESFDTLANIFPPAMLYRGAKTLANTDYGAMKDFLLGKYQISPTPRQDLQRAGQAITDLGFGALDVAPALPLVKPALKAAAPIAARQAVNMAERYGVSPTMNIVKPEGNLNLTTRLDEQIRGPETQTAFDLLKQVSGKPGVTKEGLKTIAERYPDSTARITKEEFAQSIPPSQYSKVDLKQAAEGDFDHYMNEAYDRIDARDIHNALGIPDQYHDITDALAAGDLRFSELSPTARQDLKNRFGLTDEMTDNDISSSIDNELRDIHFDLTRELAGELAGEAGGLGGAYPYEGVQRLVSSQAPHDYFEFGVTHPSQTGEYRHYRSGEAPEGLVGHVRGSHSSTEPLMLEGDVLTKPNSYVIEEIQSDAQKGMEQTGPLHQVHGTLLKSAVQDAAERGADYVYVPTSFPIGKTRHALPEDYAAIYDKAVMKEGLDPLRKIPGIEINTLQGRHLMPNLDIVDAPYYHEIKLSPEAREYILTGPGQQVPGYAAGGMVATDYDEEQIDKLSDSIFETAPSEGGVSYRDYPNPYGLRAYRNKDGSYGGEMLPKTEGWAGEQRGRGELKGSTVTEYSMDDERGSFPTINPLLSLDEIDAVAAGKMTPEIYNKSVEWRDLQARHGQSAFKNPTGFAEGGVVDKIARAGRKGQYKIAELVGLRPEVEFATEIPERYFPANEQHNARGDAMRHMLLQAQLMQKYGETPAKVIGWLHENLSGPQGDAEKAMDEYNDRLGREIGRVATDKADMAYRALQAIEKKQARTLTKEQMGEGYAEGGLVYNDEEINNLADQLLGA